MPNSGQSRGLSPHRRGPMRLPLRSWAEVDSVALGLSLDLDLEHLLALLVLAQPDRRELHTLVTKRTKL